MRNSADNVCTHPHSLFQQFFAVRIALDAVLREGHHLNFHHIPQFFPQFKNGLHSGELGVGHIHMCSDKLHAVRCLHPHGLHYSAAYIFTRQHFLTLAPALNSFKQRSGVVPVRLSRR